MSNEPKKGTGKKPKGSSRRLYTDENPKDTVSVKFSSRQDIVDTLNKASFKSKPHARQSQIINLIHQRVRAAYGRAKDPAVKKRLKTALDYAEQRKEASKRKTQSMKKLNENFIPGKAIIYPNFQGVDIDTNIKGRRQVLNVNNCIGNEPNKDYNYFTTEKKKYVEDMVKNASGDGWKSFDPIVAMPHPLLSGKYLVIDGNHRLGAFIIGKLPKIKALVLSEDQILLAAPGSKWDGNTLPETIPLKDSKGKVNLKDYFSAKPLKVPTKENLFPMKVPTKENIDTAAQKKHGGKSAPYGSAYELVKELVLQEIELVKELKCKYGTYFCPHDKVYKCRKGPKKSRSNEGVHDPMNPGILKKRLGNLSCSKVRAARGKLKDKSTTYAKALQRYLNYHCQ